MNEIVEKTEKTTETSAPASDSSGRLFGRPEPEPPWLMEGELLANSTRGKLRLFMVKTWRIKPDYYLLMELSTLAYQWVKREDLNEWMASGTFKLFVPDGYRQACDKYDWDLQKEYWKNKS